jgi:hypothetical protein
MCETWVVECILGDAVALRNDCLRDYADLGEGDSVRS